MKFEKGDIVEYIGSAKEYRNGEEWIVIKSNEMATSVSSGRDGRIRELEAVTSAFKKSYKHYDVLIEL